jgi:hyperosmotically inducible periplasmic protein
MRVNHQRIMLATATFFFLSNVPVYAGDTDDRIESSAKESYVFKNYLKDDAIKVDAEEGVVTLQGTVSDENHKALAENTVEKLPGVTKVDNKLEVQGERPAERSDGWLGLKVKTALLFHSKINPMKTKVDVKDGVVTLTGEVENQARKELATEYAKDVDGVKDVKNDMVVVDRDKDNDKMREVKEDAKKDVNEAKADAREAKEKAKADVREAKEEAKAEARDTKEEARAADADRRDDRTDADVDDEAEDKVDDASISAQAKMALLFHRSTSAISTKVDSNEGVVTLTGKAKSQAERELATKVVSDIRGVKNVVNNMEVVE